MYVRIVRAWPNNGPDIRFADLLWGYRIRGPGCAAQDLGRHLQSRQMLANNAARLSTLRHIPIAVALLGGSFLAQRTRLACCTSPAIRNVVAAQQSIWPASKKCQVCQVPACVLNINSCGMHPSCCRGGGVGRSASFDRQHDRKEPHGSNEHEPVVRLYGRDLR